MTGKVLVVDDLEQNVKLLEVKLSGEYYTVFTAYSGIEALEKVKDTSPDIILLDVMMPELDGFETCKRLKSDPETAHIPVVMITALSDIEDRIQGLNSGADDFLTKPIDEVHLFARVKSLIRLKVMIDELRMRDKTGEDLGISNANPFSTDTHVPGSILVIDDDIVQLRRIQEHLGEQGHSVQGVDHEEALEVAGSGNFDLVIINTLLDDTDGLRLAMQIRSGEETRKIPIMILVDEDDKPRLIKGLEIGVDDYIITPIDSNELVARANTQIKRKKYQDALRESYVENISAAVIDSLTKLYNRRYLDAHLTNMVEEENDKKGDLSIMGVDIDHFKLVNDRPGWGHDVGDEVLQQVADRIRNSVRTTDLATRPGGEEFVVVMPNTKGETAEKVAERMRQNMAATPFKISAEPYETNITISVGVASINKEGNDTATELLKRADEALFTAKQNGRNQVVVAGNSSSW